MKCPHCKAWLVEHIEPNAKQGAQHCYECGCCFKADGKTPREGVALCALAQAGPAEPEPDAEPAPRGRSR